MYHPKKLELKVGNRFAVSLQWLTVGLWWFYGVYAVFMVVLRCVYGFDYGWAYDWVFADGYGGFTVGLRPVYGRLSVGLRWVYGWLTVGLRWVYGGFTVGLRWSVGLRWVYGWLTVG